MPEIRAEPSDIDAGKIVMTGVVLLVTVACVFVATYLLLHLWRTPLRGANAAFDFAVQGPVLESAPQTDRRRFEAEKRALLESYGWVDRAHGVAHIPIERAMDLLAAGSAPRDAKARTR